MALVVVFATIALLASTLGTHAFTVDLIHRDSPTSPFYNPSETTFGRLGRTLRRSIYRANQIQLSKRGDMMTMHAITFSEKAQVVVADGGEYLLNISIGTPPVGILAIADTGSDLTWTQCQPCTQCYHQNAPLFNPNQSSTYNYVTCDAPQCSSLDGTTCAPQNGTGEGLCQYSMQYGDQSHTTGALSTDTITLRTASGGLMSLPGTVFGCGFHNGGTFNANGSGIVGLGGGNSSVVVQMKSLIGGLFAYCFLPISSTNGSSKMSFGHDASVSGPNTVSTPMVTKEPSTFYYLTLESLSVGDNKLAFSGGSSEQVEEGNIIIDSGTTLTLLPPDMYEELESALKEEIRLEIVDDPQKLLELCFRSLVDIVAPVITAHFSGADIELSARNTFVRTSDEVVCLAFMPNESIAIFGNLAQTNFLVGYDLNARTVSFKPAECSRLE